MRVVLTGVGVVTPGVAGGRGELAAALRGHAPRGGSRVAANALPHSSRVTRRDGSRGCVSWRSRPAGSRSPTPDARAPTASG